MFNLIITVIAILLVAAIAVAGVYYGGSAFRTQSVNAKTAQILNGGAQIKGAVDLYRNDHNGTSPSSLQALVTDPRQYLKTIPVGNWGYDGTYAISDVAQDTNCYAVNVKLGYGNIIPTCTDANYLNKPVCCTTGSTPLP